MTEQKKIGNPMTIVALVNGMIGGIILSMPILALNAGYLLIGSSSIIQGFFSFFSCLLCLRHLQHYSDLDQSILKHFNDRRVFKIIYDLIISIAMIALLIEYFTLICDQWEGLIHKSIIIPLVNAVVLFPLVYIMRKYDFGASLLGYGILSIIAYCIFLAWMLIVSPSGQNQVPPADPLFGNLMAALSQGYAIQSFFIPILQKNVNPKNSKKLLILTYILGTLVYTYIGYAGAFSLVNMKSPLGKSAQTIQQYFQSKQWEVIILQIIYLVHLYSAFPQFLIIAKKRFFSIFQDKQKKKITFAQFLFVGSIILISLAIKMIELNGSIISFMFICVIPITLHTKCVYFGKKGTQRDKLVQEKEQTKQQQLKQDSQKQADINLKVHQVNKRDIQIPMIMIEKKSNQFDEANQSSQSKEIEKKQIDDFEKFQQSMSGKEPQKQKNNSDDRDIEGLAQHHHQNWIQQSKNEQNIQGNAQQHKQNDCQKQFVYCDVHYCHKSHEICEVIIMVAMILSGLGLMCYTIYNVSVGKD